MNTEKHTHFTLGDLNTVKQLLIADTCNGSTEELLSHLRNVTSLVREAKQALDAVETALKQRAHYVNDALDIAHQLFGE